MDIDAAARLIDTYYNILDKERHKLPQVYRETSAIVYQGQPFSGPAFAHFYASMPITRHSMQSYDCHQMAEGGMLLTSSGWLRLADEKEMHGFAQSFVLHREPPSGHVFIASDTFRLVS